MIEFDYKEERLRTGEIIFRPVAKAYLLRHVRSKDLARIRSPLDRLLGKNRERDKQIFSS